MGSAPVALDAADVRAVAATASLPELDAAVSVCRACPRLVAWREQVASEKRAAFRDQAYWGRPVPSLGDPNASVLVVGLAPAAHGANRTGRMFTGDRSGDVLFASLYRTGFASQPHSIAADDGLTLSGLRIIAPCHCAPPANKPTTDELAACSGWFDRELTLMAPGLRTVVCLGGIAWASLVRAAKRLGWTVPSPQPKFGHGVEAIVDAAGHPIRLLGCYHVSQQNTFTGRLTPAMLDAIFASV